MKRWLWTAALVSCAFIAMAQLPRPDTMLPASKVSTVGLPSTDLQTNISAGELCQAPCASGSLADGAVTEPKLAAINGPAGIDEFCLTSEGTGFEWQTCGSESETNTLTTVTTGIVDDQVPVGSAAGVAQYKTIPNCIAGNVLTYTQSSNTFGCQVDAGGTETNTLTTVTTGITADQIPVGTTGGNASTYKNLPNGVVAYNTTTDVLSAAADIAQIESPGSGDQVMISDSTASSSWKSMPTTGTNGCAGAGQALQYNTSTDTLACITGLATGSGIATVQDVDGSDSQGSLSTLQFDLADGFTIAANGANTARVDIGTLPLARLADNASSGLCLLSGGAGDPAYGTCPGGGITSVGDCTTGSCFTPGGTASTYLASDSSLSLYLDQNNNEAATFRVLDGLDQPVFTCDETGACYSTPTNGYFGVTNGGDLADNGSFRLANDKSICWETASGTGVETCLKVDTTGVVNSTQGLIDVQDVGLPTAGKLSVLGSDLCWDVGFDGCGVGDPNLTLNAPTGTDGDESVLGDLNVVGDFTVVNVPEPLETVLYRFRLAAGTTTAASGGSIPGPDDCWPMIGAYELPIAVAGADPANSCKQWLPHDLHLTSISATIIAGTAPSSSCVLQLYELGERTTPGPHATFDIGSTALDTPGEFSNVALNVDVEQTGEALYFQAASTGCAATNAWPEIEVVVWGYRKTIP